MRTFLVALLVASAATPAIAGPDERSMQPGFRAAPEETGATPRAVHRNKAEKGDRTDIVEVRSRHRERPVEANAVARAHRRDIEAIRAARHRVLVGGAAPDSGFIPTRSNSGSAAPEVTRIERKDVETIRATRAPGAKMVRAPNMSDGPVRRISIRRENADASDAVALGDLRQSDRPVPRVFRNRTPTVTSEPQEGSQPPLRAERRRHDGTSWSTHWRRDRRYDWWSWRNRHRSLFRLGYYTDPFGWGYRPYAIGWRLWPAYYSSRYWLYDPWQYRLPYAPPGYRWIRYYDDALLIDTWDGRVVDVIRNFFW